MLDEILAAELDPENENDNGFEALDPPINNGDIGNVTTALAYFYKAREGDGLRHHGMDERQC